MAWPAAGQLACLWLTAALIWDGCDKVHPFVVTAVASHAKHQEACGNPILPRARVADMLSYNVAFHTYGCDLQEATYLGCADGNWPASFSHLLKSVPEGSQKHLNPTQKANCRIGCQNTNMNRD